MEMRLTHWRVLLPLGLYLAVTVPLAFTLNVWKDDAYTLHTTGSGIGYAFHQSVTFEQNAPLYYVVLAVWRYVNESAVWARLFSVLCGAAAVMAVPGLVRRYAAGIPPQWITLLVALSPALIWSALEVRIFALVIFLSALLLSTFYDAFLSRETSKWGAAAYGTLCVAAAYTQYYLVFLIAAQGVTLLVYRRSRFRAYVLAVLPLALALLPLQRIIQIETADVTGQYRPPSIMDSVHMMVQALIQYVIPAGGAGHRTAVYAFAFCAAIPAMVAFLRFRESRRVPVIVTMFAAAFIIFVVLTYAAGAWIGSRHPSSLLLPVTLSIFAAISLIRKPLRMRVAAIWIAALLCLQGAALISTYRSDAKEGDWIRVTAYVKANEKPHQPIFIFEAEDTLPFKYYYRGENHVVGVPREIDFARFDLREFELRSPVQVERVFHNALGSGHVWLVTSGACSAVGLDFGCNVLEQYVSSCCRVLAERHFYKATIRLLAARSRPAASMRQRDNFAPFMPVAAASAGFKGR